MSKLHLGLADFPRLTPKNDSFITANSFFIIHDAKQREKMTEEFYSAVKKEITKNQEWQT